MESRTSTHHNYPRYSQSTSEPPSRSLSPQRSKNPLERAENDFEHDQNSEPRHLTSTYQKSTPPVVNSVEADHIEYQRIVVNVDEKVHHIKANQGIYWKTPFAAFSLFTIGLAAAVGHSVYFMKLNEKPVGNQTWTLRYSLAIAFIFKSALGASVSFALVQHAWLMLRHRTMGISLSAIDTMFLADTSLLSFLSPSLWVSASSVGFMAASIWFMPLTALVAPTALTIGTSVTTNIDEGCVVPTVDMDVGRQFDENHYGHALYVIDPKSFINTPSMKSEKLTATVLIDGHQRNWNSPCGPDCTYQVEFMGPSWRCTLSQNVDDPSAPWERGLYNESYWYFSENGSTQVSGFDVIMYSTDVPVYAAGLNDTTNQFWVGTATGSERGLNITGGYLGKPLREMLGVQAYSCQVVNTSYTIKVDYQNGVQTNSFQSINALSILDIHPEAWRGEVIDNDPYVSWPFQDIVGMYTPMIRMLAGNISTYGGMDLRYNTSLGMATSLVQPASNYQSVLYADETLYLPRRDLGMLLEQLSYNLTISLLADPDLQVIRNTTTACYKTQKLIVWKVDWRPLVISYSIGLGVTFICLCIGVRALVLNRVVHDFSFSSVVRTTRSEGFQDLVAMNDIGAVPLPKHLGKRRLRFVNGTPLTQEVGNTASTRKGFVLRD